MKDSKKTEHELIAYVTARVPVAVVFERGDRFTPDKLEQAALENFRAHPAISGDGASLQDLAGYVEIEYEFGN